MQFYNVRSHEKARGAIAHSLGGYLHRESAANRKWDETARREILYGELSVLTDGAFTLCESKSDLPQKARLSGKPLALTTAELPLLDRWVRKSANIFCMTSSRCDALVSAVTEAAMNAVAHSGSCNARVGFRARTASMDVVQVWITDSGRGIAGIERLRRDRPARIPSVVQARLLGEGFEAMQAVDKLWVLSSPDGTTVVMEQAPRLAEWCE